MFDIANKKLNPGYRHSGKHQKGWVDTSVQPGKTEPYLSDDELKELDSIATPLREYILDRYPVEEAFDALNPLNKARVMETERILLIGSKSVSLAIWLSQWGYDTHIVLADTASAIKAQRDAKLQAGIFNGVYAMDYLADCPRARAIVVLDFIESFEEVKYLHRWLDLLLRRAEVILCCGDWNRDWSSILNKYKVEYLEQKDGYSYLAIKRN